MQITLEGKTKEQVSIERLQQYEPTEGYHLAFSGGKESIIIKNLCIDANVRFDSHYSLTGLDAPELVHFIRKYHDDVQWHKPKMSIWRYIEKKGLPTRSSRWCCQVLKEYGGKDRVVITGVRSEESTKRKHRALCIEQKHKAILNPILDWNLADVWEYIDNHHLKYCLLYDTHFDRLGCIGCPLSSNQRREFVLYPKIRDAWYRAAVRYYDNKLAGNKGFTDADHYWRWWLQDKSIANFLNVNQYRLEQ